MLRVHKLSRVSLADANCDVCGGHGTEVVYGGHGASLEVPCSCLYQWQYVDENVDWELLDITNDSIDPDGVELSFKTVDSILIANKFGGFVIDIEKYTVNPCKSVFTSATFVLDQSNQFVRRATDEERETGALARE